MRNAFVPCSDSALARAFYEATLGLPLRSDDGFALVFGVGGGTLRVVKVGDFTAQTFTVLNLHPYSSGHLLVVVTADTSQSAANGNLLATILVNPDIASGTQVASRFDHYSLLRLDEELLGLAPLANAASATDMAAGFNLPLPSPSTNQR